MARSINNHRVGNFEGLESKKMMTADLGLEMAVPMETTTVLVAPAIAKDSFSFGVEREMKESGEKGGLSEMKMETTTVLVAPTIAKDSFSFGVEREMKESGEKGGTSDMNIGIGELQECTISKSMDV